MIFALVPLSASRRSSASTALRRACSISRRRSPRCGTEISTRCSGDRSQGFAQQRRIGQLAVDQHQPRRRHFLVELGEHAGQHRFLLHPFGMGGEEGAVAPVLPAADEEGLDRDLPALLRHGEDIGIAHAGGVDRLAALDEGRSAQPVAQHGRAFEVELFRRLFHLRLDLVLHRGRLAAEEILRLAHQRVIAFLVDPARRKAPSSA